ncbi:hypothetical protein [Rhizobium sp. CF080]|uniref:hypothetical protein n=1 Tax=Rhizobium sp. (strain CF080) TaxID=1144310 RepID=UPI001FD90686|nr:hypothetical protein [Rhizobium sp. CF080]
MMTISELVGEWTYRSFRNDPDPVDGDPQKALDLFFAEAEFRFEAVTDTEFKGVIDWGSGGLDMAGRLLPGSPDTPVAFSIVGTGRQGSQTEGWQYDYNGCVAHRWPNGTNQIASLVGTVIRAKPHNGAPAGYTASFIAVKRP